MLAALLGACGLLDPTPEILDGLSVGHDAGCGACDQPNTSYGCGACESIRTIAIRHLDEQVPSHAPVSSWSFHGEGWYPGPSGEKILHTRSGSLTVGVATLADGTRHAVGIYCGVGGCR